MSTKKIECANGKLEITDDYGLYLRITDDVDGKSACISMCPDDMRKIARALEAYAEIHSN